MPSSCTAIIPLVMGKIIADTLFPYSPLNTHTQHNMIGEPGGGKAELYIPSKSVK